jgi:L-threonylcarbamoyladenylate synthase
MASLRSPTSEAIDAAADALRSGHLVAFPTETVYGLGADARSDEAVVRLYEAKGRPRFNPLIVHVEHQEAAQRYVVIDARARRLMDAFWPGPLTLVLPRVEDSGVSSLAAAGLDTLAVRAPSHPIARALLRAFGGPLVAPSANRSGRVSATQAQHVVSDFGGSVSIVLDGGPTMFGLESTIVELAPTPCLLRAGALDRASVEGVLGEPLVTPDGGPVRAPGALASHYAPALPVRLDAHDVRPDEALLAFGPPLPGAAVTINLSEGADLREAAARLFSSLRALDRPGLRAIAVMPIPDHGLGEAILDRLRRAAAPRP